VSNRRLCISAEAAATARGSAHPTLKQRRPAQQNSTDPPFQADNPDIVSSIREKERMKYLTNKKTKKDDVSTGYMADWTTA
jgi:hypothetical protein